MRQQIYLDYNASTPLAPEVIAAITPLLRGHYGNPSSSHWAGQAARGMVEEGRAQVAHLLHCAPDEVVLTGGGSEANNLALKGVYFHLLRKGRECDLHFISSVVEHPAILQPLRFLEALGAAVTLVPVDRHGRVDPLDIERAITEKTVLISLMQANNETGTIEPVEEVSAIARARGVLLHTDAAQSVGKIPTDVGALGVDLLTVAAHKFHGPKGVGALYIRRGLTLEPLLHGAGHEGGRRAGTENVILIAGLGQACAAAGPHLGMARVKALRDHLEQALLARWGDRVSVNGHPLHRLPNTLSVNFHGRIGAEILAGLKGVAASTGSACHSGLVELSPVLKAMGVSPQAGMGAIRFSLGRENTLAEIEELLIRLEDVLN